MWQEFKKFASKGNVIDLAVAVIIGTAFGKIVTSLVDDIIMPALGLILGGISFENLQLVVGEAELRYGMFIQSVVDFFIIAFSIFIFIRALQSLKRKKEEEKTEPEEKKVDEHIELLKEIRDLLKTKNSQ